MRGWRRPWSLSTQVLVVEVVVVVVALVAVASASFMHTRDTLHDQFGQRALVVARTVADLPATRDALERGVPGGELQRLVEQIRIDTGMTYIAVADGDGIRFTHPNEERIGERLSTDPSDALAGRTTISTETGTLGPTMRAKVPVFNADRDIIGLVSVGVSTSEIGAKTRHAMWVVVGYATGGLALGVIGSSFVARLLRRKTFGLGPSEIANLYENRQAMLLAMREGVVAVNAAGNITLINDEAQRLLGLDGDVMGQELRRLVPSKHFASLLDGAHGGDSSVMVAGRLLLVGRRPVLVRSDVVGAVITLRDRTELESILTELASIRGVADSLRAKAHEYSNRMHTIAGLIELGHGDEALQYATRESQFAQSLTEAYVEELGDPTLVALLLAKSSAASERGIDFHVVRDERLVTSRLAHPHGVITILGNLVDNAFEAVGSTVGGGWVHVDLGADDRALIITVKDSGPGVDDQHAPQIFEYGFSTKSASAPNVSRGLGLALVAETVAHHGGRIELVEQSSDDAFGATFRATLPDALLIESEVVAT